MREGRFVLFAIHYSGASRVTYVTYSLIGWELARLQVENGPCSCGDHILSRCPVGLRTTMMKSRRHDNFTVSVYSPIDRGDFHVHNFASKTPWTHSHLTKWISLILDPIDGIIPLKRHTGVSNLCMVPTQWNENILIWAKCLSLDSMEVFSIIISGEANDKNVTKMTTFPFRVSSYQTAFRHNHNSITIVWNREHALKSIFRQNHLCRPIFIFHIHLNMITDIKFTSYGQTLCRKKGFALAHANIPIANLATARPSCNRTLTVDRGILSSKFE